MVDSGAKRLGKASEMLVKVIDSEIYRISDRWSEALRGYLGEGARLAISRQHLDHHRLVAEAVRKLIGQLDVWVAAPTSLVPEPWDPAQDELPPGAFRLDELGTGYQRLTAIAALELLSDSTEAASAVILLEEPELGLHPGAQRRVAEALSRLEASLTLQTVVITHSPAILNAVPASGWRIIARGIGEQEGSRVINRPDLELAIQALGSSANDVFLTSRVIIVEGLTDERAFSAWARLLGYNLERMGVRFKANHGVTKARLAREIAEFVDPSIEVRVILDAGGQSERERVEIEKSSRDRVDVVVLDRDQIESYLAPRALERWLVDAGADLERVQQSLQSFERAIAGRAKEGLKQAVESALGRRYGVGDFIAVAEGTREAELPIEIRSVLARVLS